jgi:hypothetical protein
MQQICSYYLGLRQKSSGDRICKLVKDLRAPFTDTPFQTIIFAFHSILRTWTCRYSQRLDGLPLLKILNTVFY